LSDFNSGKEVSMNKKELLLAIINLTDHCNLHNSCKDCDLMCDKNKCMLRKMTLPEIIVNMCTPEKKCIVWINFEDKTKVDYYLDKIKEITKENKGNYPIKLYANNEKLVKDMNYRYDINDAGIEVLTKEFGFENVVVQEDIKGI
jgi:hypothetical protein